MKRNTDVSRIRPAEVQEPAGTGTRPSSCAAAVERATVLVVHGMRESDIPISNLGAALARMARTLNGIGTPLSGKDADEAGHDTDIQALRDAFARDIAVCIESLQFHDRLMQQLTQARDILTGLAANKLLTKVPNRPANGGSIEGSIELF